jgi:hypothetical protein
MQPKPTVGRIVHYLADDGSVQAAMIVAVISDDCVNLAVWSAGGTQHCRTSVLLGDKPGQWTWPIITTPAKG